MTPDGPPVHEGTSLVLGASRHRVTSPQSPMGAFRALADAYGAERAFLLESLGGPEEDNRFSVCGLARLVEIEVRQGAVVVQGEEDLAAVVRAVLVERGVVAESDDGLRLADDDALWEIPRAVERAVVMEDGSDDVALSVLSFMGYDAARYVEVLPRTIPDAADSPPDAVFALVDVLVQVGDAGTEVVVVRSPLWSGAGPSLDGVVEVLTKGSVPAGQDSGVPPVPAPRRITDDITRDAYLRRGEECLEHIRVGDIYQVQLGHSITIETDAEPLTVYERLRARNPSPYMALIPVAGRTVVCGSPELFVRVSGGRAVMRPIAGTARRGGDEDTVRAALLNDPKECAEHLMLVDLCRNDLGRVARPGTLDVSAFMMIEAYSHVFHIVSQVECELRAGADVSDVLRAGFPAGTMSGAPKVRAMEIIEELETTRRGFYAGAFGLLGMNGAESVLGLAIRMAVQRGDEYTLRASAGFVADSTPEGEWEETLSKMAATYWAVSGEEIQ